MMCDDTHETKGNIMPEKETRNKKHKKDSQLIIRIKSEERDQFVSLCDELDTSAAREIRHFIRDFLKSHNKQAADNKV